MKAKPCHGPECHEFLAEYGESFPNPDICALCGGEGPMCDWYIDRDSRGREERRWNDTMEDLEW